MRLLLLSVSMCFSVACSAQTVAELIGDWQFYTVETRPGAKKSQFDSATSIMSSMAMQLNADKSYTISLMGITEKGQWELKSKEILFSIPTGQSYTFTITAFEKNLITIDKEKFAVVLSRVGANVPPPPAFKEEKSYTKVTATQFSKKWYLKQFPAPATMTDKQKEEFGEKLSGSFVEFKPNGKYLLQNGNKTENGKWSLNPESNGIITGGENMPRECFIKKITATELIIIDGETDEEWIYSTIE